MPRTRQKGKWRPRPESNRGARICSPLRNHSATRPSRFPRITRVLLTERSSGGKHCNHAAANICFYGKGSFRRRPHHTETRRRSRRIQPNSWLRTNNPKGIIQNPKIGRKPSMPKKISAIPIATRAARDCGMWISRPNIFSGGRLVSSFPVLSFISVPASFKPCRNWLLTQEKTPRFSCRFFPDISAWQIGSAFAIGTSRFALFPDSSAVEQSTVNRLVASSNLARGATSSTAFAKSLCIVIRSVCAHVSLQ